MVQVDILTTELDVLRQCLPAVTGRPRVSRPFAVQWAVTHAAEYLRSRPETKCHAAERKE